jgi:hypothetical protein
LRDQDALPLLQFFSFEWYPFDEVCAPVAPQLASAKQLLTRSLERLVSDGVPRSVPWFLTEYGYSAYGSQAEVELPGALLNAGAVATFFEFGGAKTFLYGYEPGELINEQPCSWGNNMIFLSGPRLQRMPTYYGAQLLMQRWVQAAGGEHAMFAAHVNDRSLSVYALRRPDETLSLLLLNNDKQRDITVRLPLAEQAEIHQYSPAQYRWLAAGEDGRPVRNRRPVQFRSDNTPLTLPAYSLTVATGKPIR